MTFDRLSAASSHRRAICSSSSRMRSSLPSKSSSTTPAVVTTTAVRSAPENRCQAKCGSRTSSSLWHTQPTAADAAQTFRKNSSHGAHLPVVCAPVQQKKHHGVDAHAERTGQRQPQMLRVPHKTQYTGRLAKVRTVPTIAGIQVLRVA